MKFIMALVLLSLLTGCVSLDRSDGQRHDWTHKNLYETMEHEGAV